MMPQRIQIVCLSVGDAPIEYVLKLRAMLERHMPVPFDLSCVVDGARGLPSGIETIDARGWPPPREGMRMTTYKLNLFDKERVPFDEFLYLDTSLVIQKDLTPLLSFAFGRPEELVVVKDWNYDAYNTCVMRIRATDELTAIPRDYEAGVIYKQKVPGDQDFVTAVVRERGWEERVATFPEGTIQSYKRARANTSRSAGRAMLDDAVIVKFHGKPKMDQLLDPRWRLKQVMRSYNPLHRNAWFWVHELRERWR